MVLSHLTFNYIAVFRNHVPSGDFSEVLELAGGHSPFIQRHLLKLSPHPFSDVLCQLGENTPHAPLPYKSESNGPKAIGLNCREWPATDFSQR